MSPDAAPRAARHWPLHAALTVLLLLWIGFCYRNTAASMVAIWSRSETFAHGFFIAPISLWLIWRQRDRLAASTPAIAPIWTVPLLLLGVCWWVGQAIGANVVMQFAFVGMLIAAAFLMLGWSVVRWILFPLLFLLFAVPFGEFLLPLLIEKTADFTIFALRASGVPVFREGNNFQIPSGSWSVVEACSGVRYLIASVTVGALFAYLNYTSWRRRAVFVAVSIVVPILANWVRAYIIVMLGHLSNNRIATGVDHLIYGWVFFGVVISIMFAIGARWTEPQPQGASLPGGPHHDPLMGRPGLSALGWIIMALIAVWVAVPPMAGRLAIGGRFGSVIALDSPTPQLPAAGAWQVQPTPISPLATGAAVHADRTGANVVVYRKALWQVGLALTDRPVAHVAWQTSDLQGTIDPLPASKLPQTDTLALRCGDRTVPAVASQPLRADIDESQGYGGQPAIWRVQWDDGFVSGSDRWMRLHRAIARLRGKVNDTAVLSLIAPPNQPPAALKMFFEAHCGAIDAYLRQRSDALRSDVAAAARQVGQVGQ